MSTGRTAVHNASADHHANVAVYAVDVVAETVELRRGDVCRARRQVHVQTASLDAHVDEMFVLDIREADFL